MERSRVVVIGAGLAGLTAAFEAHRAGAEVIVVTRGPLGMGTNSSLAGGMFTGPATKDGVAAYIENTLDAGRRINRIPYVQFVAEGASGAFEFLRSLDLSIKETPTGRAVESPVPDIIRGVTLMRSMAEILLKLDRTLMMKGFYVTEVIVNEHGACGVRGIGADGDEKIIPCSAVILATGGAGAIYRRTDNQKKILGQGYRLAAKAGLNLWDMEFVQFYPLVIDEPRLPSLILYPPFPPEAKVCNASGEDLLAKFRLGPINSAILHKRDEFSAALYEESQRTRIYMDFRGIPDHLWDIYPLTILKKLKFDFRSKPVTVSPATHFFMGGVKADEAGKTDIAGLFACGEILWGLHGANRMGGNALTECTVTGAAAGRHAAEHCLDNGFLSLPRQNSESNTSGMNPPAYATLKTLLRKVQDLADTGAGVVRTENGMRECLRHIKELKEPLRNAMPKNRKEMILKEDVASTFFTLEAVITASLGRLESRGSFIRKDYPVEDNINWRRNSCLQYDPAGDSFTAEYVPPV